MMEASEIPVLILAGGLGTRLSAVVSDRPKPLAEVAGRPFLAWTLDRLEAAGFRDVVLCTGHLGGRARELLGERHGGLRLAYSEEPIALGTAGALRYAARTLAGGTVLALNGDSYLGLDFAALLACHAGHPGDGTLALVRVADAGRYGQVDFAEGRVRAFREKGAEPGSGWINGGVYALPRTRLLALPEGPLSLETDVFPSWIGALWGFPCEVPFLDIGLPETYAVAESFLKGK